MNWLVLVFVFFCVLDKTKILTVDGSRMSITGISENKGLDHMSKTGNSQNGGFTQESQKQNYQEIQKDQQQSQNESNQMIQKEQQQSQNENNQSQNEPQQSPNQNNQTSEEGKIEVHSQIQTEQPNLTNAASLEENNKGDVTQSIYIYVGIGVGVLVFLFILQTIAIIMCLNKVKLRRVNEIASTSNLRNVTDNERSDSVRYSTQPLNKKAKKIRTEDETNEYECLADLQRPPTPPPIDSLPRTPKPTALSSSSLSQKKEAKEQTLKNRGRMPLPHELPTRGNSTPISSSPSLRSLNKTTTEIDKNINSLPVRKKPIPPSPVESKPIVTTLPSKWKPIAAVPVLKPNGALHTPDNELMAKLKRRAEKNAILEESHQSPLTSRGSTRPLPPKAKPVPPPPTVRQTHYELEQNYDPRDSTSSDNEWTMEPLTPYNIYNV